MSVDNGSNDGDEEDADKIIRFPSLAQRDRMNREKREQEEKWRKEFARKKQEAARDANPPFFNTGSIPPVTAGFSILFLVIHAVLAMFVDPSMRMQLGYMFGFVPGYYTGAVDWGWYAVLGPLSYTLLHGGWMHVGVNAVMMLAFGTFAERKIGGRGLFLFFCLCSLGGAALTFLISPQSVVPVVGASGGISGLFAALTITFYDQGLFGPMGRRLARYGVWPLLGFWMVLMVLMGLAFGDIAWQAHVGGFVSGIVLVNLMKRGLLKL